MKQAKSTMACKNCTLSLKPGQFIGCKGECKQDLCYMCADLKPQQCEVLERTPGSLWKCKACRGNSSQPTDSSNLNELLLAMKKSMEEDRQERRTQNTEINEKLHSITSLTTKVDKIETEVATHDDRLSKLEEKMEKTKSEDVGVRQTNAIIRELREIESREKNLIFSNVPEPESQSPENRKQEDMNKILNILKALDTTDIMPTNVIRVGKKGNYHRKLLVITNSPSNCEKILEKAEVTTLGHNVFISRDRTFNQREEARLYKEEKEKSKQIRDPSVPTRGRGRGRGTRGRGRETSRDPGRVEQPNYEPKNTGSVRGRGSKRGGSNFSRKRKNSNDDRFSEKRQRSLDPPLPARLGEEQQDPSKSQKLQPEKPGEGLEYPVAPLPIAVVPLISSQRQKPTPEKPAADTATKENGTSTSFLARDFSLISPIHPADSSQLESTVIAKDFQ